MAGDDILKFLKTLAEGTSDGLSGGIAIEVKGDTIEEALAHARTQFPPGIPPEVIDIIESTIRGRLEKRDSGAESTSDNRFAGWSQARQELMLAIIVSLLTSLSVRETDIQGQLLRKAIGHMMHCDQWKLEPLEPLLDWMLAHPERLPSQVSTMYALLLDLCMGDPLTTREQFCSKNPSDTVDDFIPMMEACYPGMVHVAEVVYNHFDNMFEDGSFLEGFFSYAVPIVLMATGQVKGLTEGRDEMSAERLEEVTKLLMKDENLDAQYAEYKMREMTTAFPATRYMEMRVSGNEEGREHYAQKLHPLVVQVLDAATLLFFGTRSSDTVVH